MARVDSSYLCIDKKKIETRKQWCFFMHYSKHWKLVEIMIYTKIQSYHHLEEMLYVMNDTCFHLASLCSPVRNCCCVWGHCFLVFGSSKKSWLWCWWWVLAQTGLSLAFCDKLSKDFFFWLYRGFSHYANFDKATLFQEATTYSFYVITFIYQQ